MEDWDPNNHIENIFQSVKEGVETLLQMEAIRRDDMCMISVKYGMFRIDLCEAFYRVTRDCPRTDGEADFLCKKS
jgi:hypothetical protein